jgi:cytidylate kinase
MLAEGAYIVNTDGLDIEEVVDGIRRRISEE